jgi:diadenylate cyclase
VVDILLVTTLLYIGVVWLRRTHAALVAFGILVLGAVYLGARALGLQLTAWILQGFFAIFLIIIVVIFQEELRQLFERVAMWSLGRRQSDGGRSTPSDILIQALSDLARDRIGALVVFPGSQPISRHVRGGIPLGGTLSVPLVKSIFDPHSPGHDGAVIVEGDRIGRFAVHLPLSHDLGQLAGYGTRHAAALGLSELTDALCVVVSEERGTISVAKDGRLRPLEDPQQLGSILAEALAPPRDPSARHPWRHAVTSNWILKLVCLTVVMGLWYLFVYGSRLVQRTFPVHVTVINLPPGYRLQEVKPDKVEAIFSGPMRTFYLFDKNQLQVTVDAFLAQAGRRTFPISEENLRHPKDLTLLDVHPTQIRLTVKQREGSRARPPAAEGQ